MAVGFSLSCQAGQPEQTPVLPQPSNPNPTSSLMTAASRATNGRVHANQWLLLKLTRIEKQYWKDLWRDITFCGNSRATSRRSWAWPRR